MKCKNLNCNQECNTVFCTQTCQNKHNRNIRRFENKQKAVNYLGGRCKKCGFNENIELLHFHHLDPSDKKYDISKFISKGFYYVKAELNKCILLCFNCHTLVHKTRDPKYYIINNYFFSTPFENIQYNIIKDDNAKCTTNFFEKGKIKNRDKIIPSELLIH